jgi:hypothetical protein
MHYYILQFPKLDFNNAVATVKYFIEAQRYTLSVLEEKD